LKVFKEICTFLWYLYPPLLVKFQVSVSKLCQSHAFLNTETLRF